jgi:hypothetical protein
MDELIEFAKVCLAEDEAIAKRATDGPWQVDGMSVRGADRPHSGGKPGEVLVIKHTWPQEAAHIVRHDPGRVLREVAAKRAIVADCQQAMSTQPGFNAAHARYRSPFPSPHANLAFRTLLNLVVAWNDRPGYRPEWAPEGEANGDDEHE